MITKPITDFDPSPSLTIPRLPAASLLTLGNVLLDLTPKGDWPAVTIAAKRVRVVLDEAQSLMVERIREGGRFTREDVKFDGYADGLWGLFRDRLLGWSRYLADGRQRMQEDKELSIDLEDIEHRAARAVALQDQLFANGLDMLRQNYNQQAPLTANLLKVIDAAALEGELLDLTGDELLPMLRACQRRYAAMVSQRLSSKSGAIGDLQEVKSRIHSLIYFYTNAVIGTLSHEPANTVESVEAALLPIINVRLGREIGGRGAGETVTEDPQIVVEDGETSTKVDAVAPPLIAG
jgi:hypothetical protein